MAAKTIVPNQQGLIYLLCPFCNANALESAKSFPIHKPISINCSCGKSYEVVIEYRKAFRKKTSLPAIYWKLDPKDVFHNGTIHDLTLEGCNLLVSENNALHQGDRIKLLFKLDNSKRTKVEREAVIRRISENNMGCEFVGNAVLDPELGFYVQDFKVPK
ncbi:MAG: PilZ domain-containing protein [Pseudomonadota bacterium]